MLNRTQATCYNCFHLETVHIQYTDRLYQNSRSMTFDIAKSIWKAMELSFLMHESLLGHIRSVMSLTSSRPWPRWLCCFGEANIHVSPYFSPLGCTWNRAGCTGHCFWATTQFHTVLACPSIQSFATCTRWLTQGVLGNLKCIRTSNLQILKDKGKLPPPPPNSLQTGMTLWGQGRASYCRLCSGSQWAHLDRWLFLRNSATLQLECSVHHIFSDYSHYFDWSNTRNTVQGQIQPRCLWIDIPLPFAPPSFAQLLQWSLA